MVRFPICFVPVHTIVSPWQNTSSSSAALAVMDLNVEPGSYGLVTAWHTRAAGGDFSYWLRSKVGWFARASTSPVAGSIITAAPPRACAFLTASPSASSAMVCSVASIVKTTLWPGSIGLTVTENPGCRPANGGRA